MARKIEKTFIFDSQASRPKHAVALIYDLGGFSKFFNQPDVQDYVPKFINLVSKAMSIIFFGGVGYWLGEEEKENELDRLQAPIHEKFLGDGALYLWTPPKGTNTFPSYFIINLCNNLWNLKNEFDKVIKKAADEVPVLELPSRVRFGLARGTVYELTHKNSTKKEYIGFCINLASRLQKYCSEFGFIASARIGIPEKKLQEHGYIKVVATKIKGFPREIVIIDKEEYEELEDKIKKELFEPLEEEEPSKVSSNTRD